MELRIVLAWVTEAWTMLRDAAADWVEDKASQLGAALAFYSILSVTPLTMIAIAVAGLIFGQGAARGELLGLAHAKKPEYGTIAGVLGLITLLFGASGVFGQLQDSMNTIWEVPPKTGGGIWGFIRTRFLSF